MEVLGRECGTEVTGFWVLRWVWSGGEEQERTMERDSMGDRRKVRVRKKGREDKAKKGNDGH